MRLSSKQLYIDTLMIISTRRLAKNDDLAASDTILQISHIFGRHRVKRGCYLMGSIRP